MNSNIQKTASPKGPKTSVLTKTVKAIMEDAVDTVIANGAKTAQDVRDILNDQNVLDYEGVPRDVQEAALDYATSYAEETI